VVVRQRAERTGARDFTFSFLISYYTSILAPRAWLPVLPHVLRLFAAVRRPFACLILCVLCVF
jgi:hypothetical protein